ncbi:MAG TPA: hypothetical protein V6C50_12810 [Crinalium sp.]
MPLGEALKHFQQQVLIPLKQFSQQLDRLETKVEIGYKFDTDPKCPIESCGCYHHRHRSRVLLQPAGLLSPMMQQVAERYHEKCDRPFCFRRTMLGDVNH